MSWITTKQITEQRGSLLKSARDILTRAANEGREMTAEETAEFDKIHSAADELRAKGERILRQEEAEKSIESRIGREITPTENNRSEARARKAAFKKALRYGAHTLSAEERDVLNRHSVATANAELSAELRALSTSATNDGPELIPMAFEDKLYTKVRYYGGVKQAGAEVITTDNGRPLKVPIWDDVWHSLNTGAIGTPGSAVATNVDPYTSDLILNGWIVDSDILLLNIDYYQDTAFDPEVVLAEQLGIRVGRKANTLFTSGTGTNQPQGILTGLDSNMKKQSTSATATSYADLVNLVYSVDVAYNDPDAGEECVWMVNQNTVGAFRQLVDGNGRPLWQETAHFGITEEQAYKPTFLGYRVTVNNDLPNIPTISAQNTNAILFGNFKRGYVIRELPGVQVEAFREVFMPSLQLGFLAYTRIDGAVRDGRAIGYLNFN